MMKSISLLPLTLCSICIQGQAITSVPVTSKIEEVTLFRQGAQIERSAEIQFNSTIQQFVFSGLPASLNPQSLQLSGKGDFVILSISHAINHLEEEQNVTLKQLLEAIEDVKDKIALENLTLSIKKEELELLRANRAIKGEQTTLKMMELKEALEFFRQQMTQLRKSEYESGKKLEEYKKTLQRLEDQMSGFREKYNRPTSKVIVDVACTTSGKGKLTLRYFVDNAGWLPVYDIRVKNTESPLSFVYKAQMQQNSGEDWNNVQLRFSTGNPTLQLQKPTLYPWYINFHQPAVYSASNAYPQRMRSAVMHATEEVAMEDAAGSSSHKFKSSAVKISENNTTVEYTLPAPYTLLSNGEESSVELTSKTLPAQYKYAAVRKLNPMVFLTADITQWEDLNLLAGNASLYFEQSFVGKTYIDPRAIQDTLTLSLGNDPNITVTRVKGKNYQSKNFLGNTRTDEREWLLTVKNNKKSPIKLTLEDQIPVSTHQDITVQAINVSDGNYNKEKGSVVWNFDLQPAESKSVTLKYSVKYPKKETLILE